MAKHKIEWLNRPGTIGQTWSPVTGCTKISEGCKNCYAERMSKRLAGRFGYPADEPFAPTAHTDKLNDPLRWRKPRTVFTVSMGDLFHTAFDTEGVIFPILNIIKRAQRHTFLILTKRPEQMKTVMDCWYLLNHEVYPWPNIWLGVTAENQQRANERIPVLLQCPAAVRFVSIEPMLGPVNLEEYWGEPGVGLDWTIVGGETGPGARYMNPDWARDVRDQCEAAGVPFFFKKMGQGKPTPPDLMVRQYPEGMVQDD